MVDQKPLEEHIDFIEPNSIKDKSKRKSTTKVYLVYILAGGLLLLILGVVVGLFFGLQDNEDTNVTGLQDSEDTAPKYLTPCLSGNSFTNFSVSSDTSECSRIGCEILVKKGSAVDAAIATMLCISVVTMQSSGLGGGHFMLVYSKKNKNATFINAREKAPGAATKTMYVENPQLSKTGLLSTGVPGELKGFIKAHSMFGKLEWAELVEPAINLASEGFRVTRDLAVAIKRNLKRIKDPDFRKLLTNENGRVKKEGDKIINEPLAKTLRIIKENPESFYSGELAEQIVNDFLTNRGIITLNDLKNYEVGVSTKDVMRLDLPGNLTMLSCPLPSGGPVVMQIMNILQNFKFTPDDIKDEKSKILTYHRIIEAMKFAYARRPSFGDPDFINRTELNEIFKDIYNVQYNKELYKKIWDNKTHNVSYYKNKMYVEDKGSTSHLSVIAPNGDSVSITGSINYHFGSKVRSKNTGIIYNNEMDDFSTPGKKKGVLKPSENNFIQPGKRPLSSMSPTIFFDKNTGNVRLSIGAAGGSKIISSIAWVSIHHLYLGVPLPEAINGFRLHHQLTPNKIIIYDKEPNPMTEGVKRGLKQRGHRIGTTTGKSVVQAVAYESETKLLSAVSDKRKGGESWGV